MADNTKLQYIIELLTQGDTTKAASELQKLDKQSDATSKGLGSLTANAKQLFAVLGGTALITQSINQFIEQEKAVAKLNAALQSTGQFTPEVSAQLQELANSFQTVTNFADDAVLNVMSKLVALGARTQDVKRLTESVLDLATLLDKDLNRATLTVARALQDEFGAFKELGFQVDETRSRTEKLNSVMDQLSKKMGGQAKAAAASLGGQMESLKRMVEDAQKQLGSWIAVGANAAGNLGVDLAMLFDAKGNKEAAEAVEHIRKSNLDVLDILQRQIRAKSDLGQMDIEELNRLTKRISAARELMAGLHPNQANMSRMELRETFGNAFGQFQTTIGPVKRALGVPENTPQAEPEKKVISLDSARKDLEAWYSEYFELNDAAIEAAIRLADTRQKGEEAIIKLADQHLEDFKRGEQLKQDMADQALLTSLEGAAKEKAQLDIDHQRRLQQIAGTRFATAEQYEEALALEKKLTEEEEKRFKKEHSAAEDFKKALKALGEAGQQAFASGLSTAIVDAFEDGDKAFEKFARNFLRQIAEMILQMLILRALSSIFGGSKAAQGGQFPNRFAGGGIAELNQPTFFPQFNVLAGEAGREVMTVLSRPRLETINGVPAQVGMAGRHRLAITSADALARGGGGATGGSMHLRVTLQDGLKAEIIENSINGAVIQVTQEMQENTPLSRTTRRLTS